MEDRDTDPIIVEHFPDFAYTKQDSVHFIHPEQTLQFTDYDNLPGSLEPTPELDLFYGPRYIDEEALIESYVSVGYESPLTSEMVPTYAKAVNHYGDTDGVEGYIDLFFKVATSPKQKDRLTR